MRYSGRQLVLSQRMPAEISLIAHGLDVEQNATRLKASISLFQSTLEGLIFGDQKLRLIPAPTRGLQVRLLRVQALWEGIEPQMTLAAEAGQIDEAGVAQVNRLSLEMAQELEAVARSYKAL